MEKEETNMKRIVKTGKNKNWERKNSVELKGKHKK